MRIILPRLAPIFPTFLSSLDGLLRQELYPLSSFLIVTLEHFLGALLFLLFLINTIPEIKTLRPGKWFLVL